MIILKNNKTDIVRLVTRKPTGLKRISKKLLDTLRGSITKSTSQSATSLKEKTQEPIAQEVPKGVLRQAKARAGIHKKREQSPASPFLYCAYLLEGGTDVRYIQSFLGHNSLGTTRRYTPVSRRNVESI